jgi:lysophospholipase L1-like esterase
MRNRIALIALAPLLAAQALYARRVTPRLAEPSGARTGHDGSGPRLRLLIAGDSSAAGVGATSQQEALAGQVADALADAFDLSWRLEAQTGYAVQDVIDHLLAMDPEPFDVALICVGVNDVTGRTGARDWSCRLLALIQLLKSRFAVMHIVFSGLPPMHAFPALPQPLRWYLGARAARFDALLAECARHDARCDLLHVDFPLQADHMATDGFHPGAPAYRLWGEAAATIIRKRVGGAVAPATAGAHG